MTELGFRFFNSAYGLGSDLIYAVLLTAFFAPFMTAQGRKLRGLLVVFFSSIFCALICNRASLPQGSFMLILMVTLLAVSKWIRTGKTMKVSADTGDPGAYL